MLVKVSPPSRHILHMFMTHTFNPISLLPMPARSGLEFFNNSQIECMDIHPENSKVWSAL